MATSIFGFRASMRANQDPGWLPFRLRQRCELTPKRKLLFFFYSSLFLRAIRLLSKTSAGVR